MIDKLFELAFKIIRAVFRKGETGEKLIGLLKKYREILVYLFVGGLTTVVALGAKFLFNIVVYEGTAHPKHTVQQPHYGTAENADCKQRDHGASPVQVTASH